MKITPAVKYLLIANIAMFIIDYISTNFYNQSLIPVLGLWYFGLSEFRFYQIVTNFFMHANFAHIAFNMISLASIGNILEQTWGSKQFFNFYMLCGIGASLFHLLIKAILVYNVLGHFMVAPDEYSTVANVAGGIALGASGAIYGVFTAVALLYPNAEFYIMFIPIPIKAKYLLIGLVLIDLFLGVANFSSDPIGHFAHLGGAITGYILVKFFYNKNNKIRQY